VGGALLPFAVVLLFGWLRTGSVVPLRFLLGRGDLFPPAALLAGQTLAVAYGVPSHRRTSRWSVVVGTAWMAVAGCCVGYTVPYAEPIGAESRIVWASLWFFVTSAALRALGRKMEVKTW
jgi:hypothetical protein